MYVYACIFIFIIYIYIKIPFKKVKFNILKNSDAKKLHSKQIIKSNLAPLNSTQLKQNSVQNIHWF